MKGWIVLMLHITPEILAAILNDLAPKPGDTFDAHGAQIACLRKFPREFGLELTTFKNGKRYYAVQKFSMRFSKTIDQTFAQGPVQIKKNPKRVTSSNLVGEEERNQQWVVVKSPIVVPPPKTPRKR
jgi:hypothetical protein